MKLAIVGSRGFTDAALIRRCIERIHSQHPDLTIVSGGAQGADRIAESIAIEMGLPTIIHRPDWDRWGKSAGFRRNESIVADADVVLAFFAPGPRSRGTSHTVGLARCSRPLHVYHEGEWETEIPVF